MRAVKLRLCGFGLIVILCASASVSAAAAPRLLAVKTKMPSGVRPTFMAVGPDGTAYVQGDNPRRREVVPAVFVYSPTGRLLRRFAIPTETVVGAFGNGQLYIYTPMAERVFGVNPLNGAKVSDVGGGLPMEGYPVKLGFPVALAVGPGGTIYESGGETSILEPGNPNSTIPINPVETFDRNGVYTGYVLAQFPTIGEVTVTSVNASGDMLGIWATLQGTGIEGVVSPQGAALDQFSLFSPHPEVVGAMFAPDGTSIYAGVVVQRGSRGTDFVAKLSLGGKILEKFGTVPIHDSANPWPYEPVAVAPNGDGWAIRNGSNDLYRFHV